MTATGHLDLLLASEPGSVAHARTEVLAALDGRLDEERQDTVRLLISELVTNAVRHGGDGEPVELHAQWNSHLRVEVMDHGHGFAPKPRSAPVDEPGGYGLFLVGTLADRWGVDTDDCTTVWFELETV
jgi:anti-sigma regulatory factor (Ser/Thr protein kinase)